ncbi:MAG: acylphosphatase [Flavobacteriales bacterium]|nr:acylphosphatase [Flavobacteriales bacterium]
MKKRLNITVSGKVQGVYFRRDTERAAKRLGVVGTVANKPNGSVYIEAEADEDTLQQFVAWCHEGPELANVTQVDTEESVVTGFTSFDVLAEPSDYLGSV